jgi:hypothetical protein
MKNLPIFCLLLALAATLASANAPVQSSDVWVSRDPNTRSIVRVEFMNQRSRIRVFGACSPNPCDWGVTSVKDDDPSGANSPSEGHPYSVTYDSNVATRSLRIVDYGTRMDIFMTSDFKDSRPTRETKAELVRQR